MDISDWRKKVDELDRKLAALLNERAAAVVEIIPRREVDRRRVFGGLRIAIDIWQG